MVAKVSVIVPIFNVEPFLERSIKSLMNQTLKEIEFILVDDGSMDRSLEICKKYQKKDPRIIVIHQKNKGVSAARNQGMKIAKGQYIGFIDPDDWVELDMFENLYNTITTQHSQMAMCNYFLERTHQILKTEEFGFKKNLLNREDVITLLVRDMLATNEAETIMGSVCRILVKTTLVQTSNLKFDETIHFMEDLIFTIQALLHSEKVSIIHKPYYHYELREGSAVTSYQADMLENSRKVFALLEAYFEKEKISHFLKKTMDIRYIDMHLYFIINELHKDNEKGVFSKLKYIYSISNSKRFRTYLNTVNLNVYPLKKRVLLSVLKYTLKRK